MSGVPTDPAQLRAWRDATFYRLLFRASQAERRATLGALHAQGYVDVTHADTGLLASLDTDGTTITALARRTGVTRQAASQQVAALEREGYVVRQPNPADSRAVLVQRTELGQKLLRAALDVVGGLEGDYERHLGAAGAATLRSLLARLLEHSDPGGGLAGTVG